MNSNSVYYKGYEKESDKKIIIEVFEEPKDSFFGNTKDVAEIIYLDEGSRWQYHSFEELNENCYVQRQISVEEFKMLQNIAYLSNEIWMNQFTGGFPDKNRCGKLAKYIQLEIFDMLYAQDKFTYVKNPEGVNCNPSFIPTGNPFVDFVGNVARVQGAEAAVNLVENIAKEEQNYGK